MWQSSNDLENIFLYSYVAYSTRITSAKNFYVQRTPLVKTRGGVHEDVLGLEDTFWNPWPRCLKSSALASKPQVLENCPVLDSRTALFFEQLKFRWKTPETSRKVCEHLFCFSYLEHRRRQEEGGQGSLPNEISPMTKMWQKSLLFLQFQFLFSIFRWQQITN